MAAVVYLIEVSVPLRPSVKVSFFLGLQRCPLLVQFTTNWPVVKVRVCVRVRADTADTAVTAVTVSRHTNTKKRTTRARSRNEPMRAEPDVAVQASQSRPKAWALPLLAGPEHEQERLIDELQRRSSVESGGGRLDTYESRAMGPGAAVNREIAEEQGGPVYLPLGHKQGRPRAPFVVKTRLFAGHYGEAAEGIRTLDLLHGKQFVRCPLGADIPLQRRGFSGGSVALRFPGFYREITGVRELKAD